MCEAVTHDQTCIVEYFWKSQETTNKLEATEAEFI